MNKLLSLAIGATAFLFASCASEEPLAPDHSGTGSDGDVYATLTLRLPSASTRANNGDEYGQDEENNVGKIMVLLATKNETGQYCYLTKALTDAKPNTSGVPANQLKYTLNFKASDMAPNPLDKNEPGSGIPGTEVYVFVYCNPSDMLINRFNMSKGVAIDNVYAQLEDKDNSSMWTANRFLMTNSSIATPVTIPSRDVLVTEHNVPEKAFQLGVVPVKRCCARFDFATTNDNLYDITDIDGDGKIGTVELTDMAMFNIQKEFYYLPHVSSTWTWTMPGSGSPNYTLCGDLEGFVMSYNEGNFKNAANLSQTDYRKRYFSTIIGNDLVGETGNSRDDDDLKWTSIRPSDWQKNSEDNNEGWTPNQADYRIWRYTTENTIPAMTENGATTAAQRQGITTGVVFKGEFTPVNTGVWNGNVIYVHNNIVYGDFKALKEYVQKNPESIVAGDFKQVSSFQSADADKDLKKNLMDGLTGDARHNFKAYAANAQGKYVMYYFYYNRHNSNGNDALMADNEFGVVRNNVYKLRVNTIRSLGEPKSPTDPNNPDEQENAYFSVSCLVMPWTVRVNDIEF